MARARPETSRFVTLFAAKPPARPALPLRFANALDAFRGSGAGRFTAVKLAAAPARFGLRTAGCSLARPRAADNPSLGPDCFALHLQSPDVHKKRGLTRRVRGGQQISPSRPCAGDCGCIRQVQDCGHAFNGPGAQVHHGFVFPIADGVAPASGLSGQFGLRQPGTLADCCQFRPGHAPALTERLCRAAALRQASRQ
ncbi:hypothetical protein SAMN05216376_10613 [Mameliella alba]|nr:hypothetical protein LX94_02265 [Mameliella alba]SDD09568.1 hypothetical protein SAMN05216376_10613 [Mameliella alba]